MRITAKPLENIRKKLGFETKQSFAKWLGINYYQYSRWTKKLLPEEKPIVPELEQLVKMRDKIRERIPETTIDDLLEVDPE